MADPKEKRGKIAIPTREPHKKTRTGIFDNLRQLPHPVEEFLSVPAEPRQTSLPSAKESVTGATSAPSASAPNEHSSQVGSDLNSESLSNFAAPLKAASPAQTTTSSKTNSPAISEELADSAATLPPSSTDNLSPVKSEGLVDFTGPVKSTSPVKNKPSPLQFTGLTEFTGPVKSEGLNSEQSPSDFTELSSGRPDFSLLNSLPDVPGYTPAFHQITDYLHRQLTTAEQAIYNQLYRLTWGYEKPKVIVGFPKLAERANVGESTARAATKSLESKGLIKRHGVVFGLGQEQGIEWEVYPPSSLIKHLKGREERKQRGSKSTGPSESTSPVEFGPIKDNVLFSKHTQTQTRAGGLSRFTLEECRRYANHLKATGQGITNPGGYATKIFRSGEADALMETFLKPPSQLDISKCEHCRGSGFVYIDLANRDKGVKPCRHESLKS